MKLPMTIQPQSTEIDHAACGRKVRDARESKRLGLRQLAGIVGISAPYLSDLENGRRNWTQEKFDSVMQTIKQFKTTK